MNKVAIIGVGHSKFGNRTDVNLKKHQTQVKKIK